MFQNTKAINIPEAVSSGITGTTFMTLFSFIISEAKDRNFKEPELLGILLRRILHGMNKNDGRFAGWMIHYAVGILFALFYVWLWNEKKLKPTYKSGVILGAISGIIGALVWHLTFKLHPSPPKIAYKKYYGHLLVTHVVFGIFAVVGYKIRKKFLLRTK